MHSYFGLCHHSAHNDHKLIPVAYLVFFATYSKLEILVDDLSVIFTWMIIRMYYISNNLGV